jgi:P4 family phage/plasmid primase-like protien
MGHRYCFIGETEGQRAVEELNEQGRVFFEQDKEGFDECPIKGVGLAIAAEALLFAELKKFNAEHCDPKMPLHELRRLSVDLYEELAGMRVPEEPGMFTPEQFSDEDTAFGKDFIREYGWGVRYNPSNQTWLTYEEGVWKEDDANVRVVRMIKEFFLDQKQKAEQRLNKLREDWEKIEHKFFANGSLRKNETLTEDEEDFVELWFKALNAVKRASKGLSAYQIRAALQMARTENDIAMSTDQWDADPLIFNCQNATIDLATGETVFDRRQVFCTLQARAIYDDAATCPTFEQALERSLPDATIREYLQYYAGLSLSGLMAPEVLIFLGDGANGKGLINRIFAGVLGSFYAKASMSTFLATKTVNPGGARSDLSGLRGKRLIAAAEANRKVSLDMEMIKDWTGGEAFNARDLWEKAKHSQFPPQGKLLFSMNHPPRISDQTHAAWRRLRYIDFKVVIPEAERNEHLADEIIEQEGPGVLNWMLAGWQRVRDRLKQGKPALVAPQSVMAATLAYKDKENPVARFWDDKITIVAGGTITSDELYASYKAWCESNGEKPWRAQTLVNELKRFAEDKKCAVDFGGRHHHAGQHRGISLLSCASEPQENADKEDPEPQGMDDLPF